jgi:ferrochelatase
MTKRAVILANLGSPDSPDVSSVRRYLNQFLMDPYVIQLPWLFRRMIVSLFVLPLRPKNSAEAYQSVWTEHGSPLLVLSKSLQDELQKKSSIEVGLAMRYGKPAIPNEIKRLVDKGVRELLFLPLYPHYAESTVLTSINEAEIIVAELNSKRTELEKIKLIVLPSFYEHPDYIKALVASALPSLEALKKSYDHLVFSYHGLPESHLIKADPTSSHCMKNADCCQHPSQAHSTCYRHQVLRTTAAFVESTGICKDQYSVAFQSRLGRQKWLEPSTESTIKELAVQGKKRVLVICPAFVTDCLETLEEIAIRGNEVFQEAGGELLTLVPCMNTHPAWVETLAKWINSDDPVAYIQPVTDVDASH